MVAGVDSVNLPLDACDSAIQMAVTSLPTLIFRY